MDRPTQRFYADALPSQVSEARAPQSPISRWQFPLDYAVNIGIWRMVGTTANSPDADELAVVRFLAVRSDLEPSARGNPERTPSSIILSILDTMVENVGTVGPLVADKEWQAMACSKAKDKGFPAIRLS